MFTKEMAVALLRQKQKELERLPKKEDFADEEIGRIKSRLGPWPRALEEAGLKEKRKLSSAARKKRRSKEKKEKEDL